MNVHPLITLHDKTFEPYINEREIQETILALAGRINHDYAGKQPVFIGILNGAFMFVADLLKHIALPCEVSFVKLSSYEGTASTGQVMTDIHLNVSIKDRDVIILEDIIDTGSTMHTFLPQLQSHSPHSIAICTLLCKPTKMEHIINIRYIGREIDNLFIVGYGLDYNGLGRNLRSIYKIM